MRKFHFMSGKDAGLRSRVEKELREAFQGACVAENRGATEVLRAFCRRSSVSATTDANPTCSRPKPHPAHANKPREKRYEKF